MNLSGFLGRGILGRDQSGLEHAGQNDAGDAGRLGRAPAALGILRVADIGDGLVRDGLPGLEIGADFWLFLGRRGRLAQQQTQGESGQEGERKKYAHVQSPFRIGSPLAFKVRKRMPLTFDTVTATVDPIILTEWWQDLPMNIV